MSNVLKLSFALFLSSAVYAEEQVVLVPGGPLVPVPLVTQQCVNGFTPPPNGDACSYCLIYVNGVYVGCNRSLNNQNPIFDGEASDLECLNGCSILFPPRKPPSQILQ